MVMLRVSCCLLLSLCSLGALAQLSDNEIRVAIIERLPDGITAETATADQVGQAALELALGVNGKGEEADLTQAEMQGNLTRVMKTLVEMTREGMFANAPRYGDDNPPGRLYLRVLNVASSNLDVASDTYFGTTNQYIIGLAAAMREGQNLANNATANAITRK
jgi:hypothetical protein